MINVLADGTVRVDGKQVGDEELHALLEAVVEEQPDPTALVRADMDAPMGAVTGVVNVCERSGVRRMSFRVRGQASE